MDSKVPYANCEKCPFANKRIAKTTGPPNASIAFVSRSPGYHEGMAGKSFSGPSGKVLDHLLVRQGITREEILATNVVLCQSDGPEDPGWDQAVECCAPRLENELANCKTVIAGGTEASRSLVDDFLTIGTDRGYVHDRTSPVSGELQRIVVTNNPAVVIRDDANYPEMVRDFKLAINPLPKPKLPTVRWIDNVADAKLAVNVMMTEITKMGPGTIVASDIEARGTENVKKSGLKHTAEIVCAGFSIRPERAVVFGEKPCSDETFRGTYLKGLYEISNVQYLWHNGKYDIKVLRTNGINARVDEDTLLLSWALDERPGDPESGAGGHSLEWLLKDELGWPRYEPYSVKDFKKMGNLSNPRELYEYNGFDTAGSLGLYDILVRRAKADNVWDRPYRSMLLRLSEALTKIELEGNLFDSDRACDILEEEVWPKLKELKNVVRHISRKPELNPNSSTQLKELYYEDWGLKHNLKRPKIENKGKISTDKYVREEITRGDFVVAPGISREAVSQFTINLNDFKTLFTQESTFFRGLVLRRSADGRIYTDYKIHGTESGRLSSSNPNMQNVTRTKEGMPSIRSAFIPDPGCTFVSADLSQAELRAIAVLSGDENLRSIYLDTSRSLHKEVATQFYGENYTYEQYVIAKNINFGVAYWISAFSFAQLYHMPQEEAQKFIDFWWGRFPKVKEWTHSVEEAVLKVGQLQSPFGHKRRFYVIPKDYSGRLHVIKEGINFLPQNIAGNITLWAMCDLCENLDWSKAQVRINVHDNIVLNVKEDYAEETASMVKEIMESAARTGIGWDFPFLADVSIGPTWGNLVEMRLPT